MKKIDYYAVHNPWRMPKWLGIMLGGVFGVIAVGSMITIVQLTRSPAAPAPVAALAAAPALQAPAAAPVAAAAAPAAAKATAPAAPAVADAAPAVKHAKKHAAHKHGKMLASAKRSSSPSLGAAQRQTILAKHDTKSKRGEKDALDKLLGL